MNKPASKNIVAAVLFLFLSHFGHAQNNTAQFLKGPADWSFERFNLPPSFAPGFPYKGVEELRFSPGMFNKNSSEYFTYAFVAELDSTANISQDDIKNYLLAYFKGLCSSTAREHKLVIDTSGITVKMEKRKDVPKNEAVYNAALNIFGVFADGAPVKLNMEIKVMMNDKAQKAYLFFIASPHEKRDDAWKKLYQIRQDFVMPN